MTTPPPKSGPTEVTRVPKPWGHETIWAQTDRYVGKILHINAGAGAVRAVSRA